MSHVYGDRKSQTAISIRQSWAWLIVNGYKDIENRTWKTHYRGKILIHAAQKFDIEGYEWVNKHFNIQQPLPSKFERGGIVGEANLVDCVRDSDSIWFSGPNGFVLTEARPFQSIIESHGKLGIFHIEIPLDEIEQTESD